MVRCATISAGIGSVVCIFGAILGWGLFPMMINKKVAENIILTEGTDQFERFVTVPQPLLFKVYVFNVTNAEKVMEGDVPVVQEVGPYIYKQYRKKSIKEFSKSRTTVTYTQQQTFLFDELASVPFKQSDKVVVLNMHMNAFLQVFEGELRDIFRNFATRVNKTLDRTPVVRILKRIMQRIRGKRKSVLQKIEGDPGLAFLMGQINSNLNSIFNNEPSVFLQTTVGEYLFGGVRFCIDPVGLANAICRQIKDKGSSTIREMEDGSLAFSFFNHKNTTHDGVYEVNTGVGDPQRVIEIQRWREGSTLQIWLNASNDETSICNLINGTDASYYPPYEQKGGSMFIFSSEICRSVQLFYQSEIKYKGVPGFRYSIGDNFLNQIGPEYSNECFCINKMPNIVKKKNGCLYSGALDLSNCIDAPVVLTMPHMLGASKEYTRLVKGLKPDPEKHQIFIDVQHLTGAPLQGGKRVQFNMFVKHINKITLTENLTTSLVPAVWVEEGIALNAEMVQMIESQLLNALVILGAVHYILFIGGLIIVIVSVGLYMIQNKMSSQIKN